MRWASAANRRSILFSDYTKILRLAIKIKVGPSDAVPLVQSRRESRIMQWLALASRSGRISDPRRCRAAKGVRPRVPRQIVREYLYVYAAVCPALGKMTALLLPWANTDMMNIFLEEVSRGFNEFLVIMQVDQAGWHKSKKLRIPENIRLLPQAATQPRTQPVEHLWEELREKACPNQAFKSLHEVENALCQEIGRLPNDPARLRSLTNFPHLRVPC